MKKLITFILFVFAGGIITGGAILDKFQARSENDKVVIEWKTREESGLKHFVVERKSLNNDFIPIGEVQPKGSYSSYTFTDETAFKNTGSIYYYRIKIVDSDGSVSFSSEISVFHSVSSVKRTWGSIKAMFR